MADLSGTSRSARWRLRHGILASFRSDNLYVWQDRHALDPRARQFLTALDAARRCAGLVLDGARGRGPRGAPPQPRRLRTHLDGESLDVVAVLP